MAEESAPIDVVPVLSEQHEAAGIDYAYLETGYDASLAFSLPAAMHRPETTAYLGEAFAVPDLRGPGLTGSILQAGSSLEITVPRSSLPPNIVYWRLYVDGQMAGFTSSGSIELSAYWLAGLSRGEHEIQVEFLDDEFAPVAAVSSPAVVTLVSALGSPVNEF
ncbi:MAG: hypothetical protein HY671_11115 [Chloroflexi bacterium]|nr:hypothetical protein [Chloroflexota bacterium]